MLCSDVRTYVELVKMLMVIASFGKMQPIHKSFFMMEEDVMDAICGLNVYICVPESTCKTRHLKCCMT